MTDKPGAEAYKRDVPDAEIHIVEAGHFALAEKVDEIAELMLSFLAKQKLLPPARPGLS
jgi:hypothetical protein